MGIARMIGSGTFRALVWTKTAGRCWYCGVQMAPDRWTVDHVQPRSAGGHNDMENLVPCCHRCNRAKADRSLEGFRDMYRDRAATMATYLFWFEATAVDF